MRAMLALVALACAPALADEGELYLGGGVAAEVAWLRHPLAGDAVVIDERSAFAVVPRIAVGAQYGWTNELHLGVTIDAGATANVVTDAVNIGGAAGQLVTGGYFDVAALATGTWRIDSGFDVSTVFQLELGAALALWSANALADPAKRDAEGRPARLPIDIADASRPAMLGRLAILFELRLFENIALRAGPYVGASWSGSLQAHVGLRIEPLFPVSPLPH